MKTNSKIQQHIKTKVVRLLFSCIILFSAVSLAIVAPTMVVQAQTNGSVYYGTYNGQTGIVVTFPNQNRAYIAYEITDCQGNVVLLQTFGAGRPGEPTATFVLPDEFDSGKYTVSVYKGPDSVRGTLVFSGSVVVP
jgi:hypothetical protein